MGGLTGAVAKRKQNKQNKLQRRTKKSFRGRIWIKFSTTSSFILNQLEYELEISMRDS